jgi:GntR family transcriptional regulator
VRRLGRNRPGRAFLVPNLGFVTDRRKLGHARRFVYQRVADDLAARIDTGELPAGAQIPAERDLAEAYGVSYDSVRRATAALRDWGLIVTVHGKGTYVHG